MRVQWLLQQALIPHLTLLCLGCLLLGACQNRGEDVVAGTEGAEERVGERLFLETRFAQAFKTFLDSGGSVNASLPAGDPILDTTETTGRPLPGPFAGLTINCRSCHLVDEHVAAAGTRAYTDFARRSPVPDRGDGILATPRHSPPLVNASLERPGGELFHFDAEFAKLEDLIAGTFTGRNFGWLPAERQAAVRHIATVVRDDDGAGELAQEFGGLSYRALLDGLSGDIPEELILTPDFRIEVETATDEDIFEAVNILTAAYVRGLQFSQEDEVVFQLNLYV